MNYTKKSFTVGAPGTKSYADNWERTFRGEETTRVWRKPGELPEAHAANCDLFENGLHCSCGKYGFDQRAAE